MGFPLFQAVRWRQEHSVDGSSSSQTGRTADENILYRRVTVHCKNVTDGTDYRPWMVCHKEDLYITNAPEKFIQNKDFNNHADGKKATFCAFY